MKWLKLLMDLKAVDKVDILLVNPLLSGIGGIQSSLINLINNINHEDINIDLCIFGNYISNSTSIPSNVNIIVGPKLIEFCLLNYNDNKNNYGLFTKLQIIFVKTLRRIIGFENILKIALIKYKINKKYDVAISYSNDIFKNGKFIIGGANKIVQRAVSAKKKIAWVHNDPIELGFNKDICERIYKDFDTIVNVSYTCKEIFDKIIPEYRYKSKVVYNMFDNQKVLSLADEKQPYDKSVFNIVTVARIDNQQKRIDRIIECCVKLKQEGITNFKWTIVGDGPDLEWLTKEVVVNKVDDVIGFVGRKRNPYPYMRYADLFVLTSLYESYGMVLKEALITGTPVVTTKFDASSEIIDNKINGFIVENSTSGVFYALTTILKDQSILKELRKNISINNVNNNQALNQFFELIGE
jgi:glycosyltransferase involved in cell wall biosynthesis